MNPEQSKVDLLDNPYRYTERAAVKPDASQQQG
jgi:hypothetical protein